MDSAMQTTKDFNHEKKITQFIVDETKIEVVALNTYGYGLLL
jgi:hypothetical protein